MTNISFPLILEMVQKVFLSIKDVLPSVDTFSNIIVNIVVIAGGILGFNYVRKMREKQFDASFSYLTRINVRLKFFRVMLEEYKDEIMDRFLQKSLRRDISPDRIELVDDAIKLISDNAAETLKFLQDENNQIPAQRGWVKCFNRFIDFLIDCEQLGEDSYFKWMDNEHSDDKKEIYYKDTINNIEELLSMVNAQQEKLEIDIFKNDSKNGHFSK